MGGNDGCCFCIDNQSAKVNGRVDVVQKLYSVLSIIPIVLFAVAGYEGEGSDGCDATMICL